MTDIRTYTGSRKYSNDEITVYWKPAACVHATHCYKELIEVFNPDKRPWVNMKGAPTDEIIEVVDMCPTEALTWKWNDEEKNKSVGPEHTNHVKFRRPELLQDDVTDASTRPVMVKVYVDGPVVIKGDFTLVEQGNRKEMKGATLSICRCGISERMPICDGSHIKSGFNG